MWLNLRELFGLQGRNIRMYPLPCISLPIKEGIFHSAVGKAFCLTVLMDRSAKPSNNR